jgi:DNA-binding NarL/FixJ family response regulator
MKEPPKTPEKKPEREPPLGRKRILIVDDHPMMRAGLAQLINRQADMVVWAEASQPAEALSLLSRTRPELVLADLTMPGRSGIEFIKDLIAAHADLAILVVSMRDETLYAERCLRAGARGYIMKEAGSECLLAAMRRVMDGKTYLSASAAEGIVNNLSPKKPRGSDSPIRSLSDREFEIFRFVGHGKSAREIAAQLHLSHKTVDVHRGHIREKLDLKDLTSLLRFAVRWVETENAAA